MLEELEDDLEAAGTRLVFAEMKDAVRHKMESYELTRSLTDDHFYPTVRSAVDAYEQTDGASWVPGPSPYHLD